MATIRVKPLAAAALAALAMLLSPSSARADYPINWEASTTINAGSGNFSPYYIASNSDGVTTQPAGAYERGRLWRDMSRTERFSYGFGIDAIAGWSDPIEYSRYDKGASQWVANKQRPAWAWLQQLYGEVKWRSLFLVAGMKQNDRSLFDNPLGSGDITLSRNARPIPQVRAGFIDFQNIPFTNGWVQIRGEIAYGKFADADWNENHYNRYNSFLTTGVWFHYKSCYFRTNPDQPFSVTVGLQNAAQFGGSKTTYIQGTLYEPLTYKTPVKFKDFVDVFLQKSSSAYYNGNSLGSWDLRLRYRFHDGTTLTAYMQSPWEDGSGIGKLNGWDGVWGLEYKASKPGIVDGVVLEYLDFTNQSGPIHYAPGDFPGTHVTGQASGADNYYNNYMYNGWTNYGMSIGTPFLKSTFYNLNGHLIYMDNRARGFHLGIGGHPLPQLDYRLLLGYRTSWGTPMIPRPEKVHDTSMMLEARYRLANVKGLTLKAQFAFDAGSLYGNNVGFLLSAEYRGLLTFKSRK